MNHEPTEQEIAQLEEYLQDNDYKEVLQFCDEPKAWKELSKLKIRKVRCSRY